MAFTGTQEKCKACDKTVHIIDTLMADGASYHRTCFKCNQCKTNLSMSNYCCSKDGVLYCKIHFEQLFKEGVIAKKTSGTSGDQSVAATRASSMFSGTQDKCAACQKTVYPLEKLTLEGECYHKGCFKCSHGGCILTTSSYAALNGVLYCKIHFSQLFKEKGTYDHLIETAQTKKEIKDTEEAAAHAESQAEAEAEANNEKEQDETPQEET